MLVANGTTSSEDLVGLETKTIRTPSGSRHRARRKMKIAARIALVLAFVIWVLAIADFAFNAYKRTDCYTDGKPNEWGLRMPVATSTDECRAEINRREKFLRLDFAAAVLAAPFLIASTVISRRVRRHRRRQ